MPKIIIHAPKTTFDSKARQAIAAELTDFALDCEALPQSPFVKSTVWTSEGATSIIGRQLGSPDRVPVYNELPCVSASPARAKWALPLQPGCGTQGRI